MTNLRGAVILGVLSVLGMNATTLGAASAGVSPDAAVWWIEIVSRFGVPLALAVYLLYLMRAKDHQARQDMIDREKSAIEREKVIAEHNAAFLSKLDTIVDRLERIESKGCPYVEQISGRVRTGRGA